MESRGVRPPAHLEQRTLRETRSLMEKRAILAAVLMAGLLIVYQFLFVKPAPPPQEAAKAGAPPNETAKVPEPVRPSQEPIAVPPAKEAPRPPERPTREQTPHSRDAR